jgi:hypothetical protein
MHDPRVPKVDVPLHQTAALLLARLCNDLQIGDPAAVIARALGLLDLALKARAEGRRLALYDPASGELSDVAA